ncbi:uncharacterized protein PRCAT00001071001 [Priceomyces carsonii]|uniref:uncharacterized protein n=1 Tax=Priceomyces carsonii TaxID=28549 RepID=UPI002ED9C039|nr:unnamed protein product [Priceomyces carsonii]
MSTVDNQPCCCNPEDANYDIEVHQDNHDHSIVRVKYRTSSRDDTSAFTKSSDNGLPTIKVLGTGGTIASKGQTAYQTAGYKVDMTIEDLIETIPDLSMTCNLQYEQVLNVDSSDIGTKEVLTIYQKVAEDIESFDGIVITHGTDTMEETAFFLQLTINTHKPIVMCGSMRPSTAISSDGPMNLYQAIVIAANKNSKDRGVLVALNDRIGSGFYITKSNANSLDTFKSIGQGYLGSFVNNHIHYYFPAVKPLGITYFDLNVSEFVSPEVPILYAHQDFNDSMIEIVVKNLNAKGLVLATMGAGSMSSKTNKVLARIATERNIPVVYSKRSMDGMIPTDSLPEIENAGHAIASGYLNPQKARILLQFCLYKNFSIDKIKESFEVIYGG